MRTLVTMATVARGVAVVLLLTMLAYPATADQVNRSSVRTADVWVTTQIQARYFVEPGIKARTIDVTTLNGVVTLDGDVATPEERTRALEIASQVAGVKRVVTNLSIAGQPQPQGTSGDRVAAPTDSATVPAVTEAERVSPAATDPVILSEIKLRYAADPQIRVLTLHVAVSGGVVTLTGDVLDRSVMERAEALAREVPGVTQVRNELKLKR